MSAKTRPLEPAHNLPSDLRRLLTLRWLLTTLLAIAAVIVMVRLGIWQLDRLAQRRAINAQHLRVMSLPPLDLNQPHSPADLAAAIYQDATVSGVYDASGQVLLRNQVWDDRPGYHLLTPLVMEGSGQAVLVDRGWIPMDQAGPQQLAVLAENGRVTVRGRLMPSQSENGLGIPTDPPLVDGQTRLDAWNRISLERIRLQVRQPLLPVYLIAAPETTASGALQRSLPEVDLSEGPHQGYAIQWFIFAAILAIGYPFYVRKQLRFPASHA
ncbi:MAG TPA: SURF1 family protein [Anaerolinea sp.]|nr:SURF1 family protein [Anaerolinea sp.]